MRSYFYESIGDELVYRFLIDEDFSTKYYTDRIESLGDAIESQSHEWFNHSGRFLVHVITQMFAGVWGRGWFSVFNAIIFFVTSLLFWRYANRKGRTDIFYALVIALVLSYICPGGLFRPIAVSLNYLWPMPLVLLFIHLVKRLCENSYCSDTGFGKVCLCAVFGFIVGSTQEVYIFPLCVTTFIIICRGLLKKKKISGALYAACIALWIGSALVIFAPGTLHRGSGLMGNPLLMIYAGVKMLIGQKMVWIAMLLAVIARMMVGSWKNVFVGRYFEISCLLWAVSLALVAHTTNQSFAGVEFYSILVALSLFPAVVRDSFLMRYRTVVDICCLLVLLGFIAHQSLLVRDDRRYEWHNHAIVQDYIDSPDGIVAYTPIQPDPMTCGFQVNFEDRLLRSYYRDWFCYTLQVAYGGKEKELWLMTDGEIDALSDLKKQKNLAVPGDAGFYKIGRYVVAPVDSISLQKDSLVVVYKRIRIPSNIMERLTAIVRKAADMDENEFIETVKFCELPIKRTRWGNLVVMRDYQHCVIESINFK